MMTGRNQFGDKWIYEEVKKFFADNGCDLISKEYINARTHLEYKCSCGNVSRIIFDSFRRGHRCRKCGDKRKVESHRFTIEEV
jgi:hypothetical protein